VLASSFAASAAQLKDGGGVLIDGSVSAPPGTTQVYVWRTDTDPQRGARRVASATPPKVKLKSPRGGSTVGGANLKVTWAATDPDGPIEATVEYAADGRHFTGVYTGPAETGTALVPRSMLAGSTKAKVRVSVDDGFQVDTATSKPFTVVPPAPLVQISEPPAPVTVAADGPLNLNGSAFGPHGVPLRAKALSWSDGKEELGKGETLTVSGLKPGRHKLTLSAKSGGKTGKASVVVTVTAVQPQFLELTAPPISANAKKLKLRVASTVTAKLKVGKQSFKVGPKATTLKGIKVPKGKGTFALPVTLKAGGQVTTGSVVVVRG
jgi:hypothetical protein